MYLQASGGFAPNVNVQVQSLSESIAECSKLTEAQVNQLDPTMLKAAAPSPSYEYAGAIQDSRPHRAVREPRRSHDSLTAS